MASRTGVVTPEGVFLDYRPAGLATRTVGKLIDVSLQILMAYALLTALLLSFAVSGVGTVFIVGATVIAFLILFGYPVLFEIYGGGRTPGHRATGTRVIRTDGGPVRVRHAAIRAMLFLVDGLATTGFAGAVSVLVTKRGQRLGDLAAGTMVVRLDSVARWEVPSHARPRKLSDRAATFDIRRLDQADIALAEMLMERGAELFPGAQVDLATRIAARLDDKLGSVMVDADRPSDFIAAVVTAHHEAGSASTPGAVDASSEVSTQREPVAPLVDAAIEASDDGEDSSPGFAVPT